MHRIALCLAAALAIANLLAGVASWFGWLPGGGRPGGISDLDLYFLPTYEAYYGRAAAGHLPTWNPFQLCGIPWLATLQGGFFYPVHLLYLVLPLPVALAASRLIHITLAALFMVAFARRAGLTMVAAILAAVLYALRGMFVMGLSQPNWFEATTWLPLAALGVLDLTNGSRVRGGALIATSVGASFLAGYPQPTTYMLYTLPTLLAAALLAEHAAPRRWIASGGILCAAIALGILAAAIQLLPALELVRESAHRDLSPQARGTYLSPAAALLAHSLIAGGAFSWGIAALALATIAPFNRRSRAVAWWAIAIGVLAVLFALGDRTPLVHLYLALPFLDAFRFPDRALGVTDFAVAVAAAVGLDAVLSADAGVPRRRAATVALGTVAALVAMSPWWGARGTDQMLIIAGGLITAVLLLLTKSSVPGRPATVLAMSFVLVVMAQLQPWRYVLIRSADVQKSYDTLAADYRALAARIGHDRAWFSTGLSGLNPAWATKLATRYGVRSIEDYEPLPPRRQGEYFAYLSEGRVEWLRAPWLFNGQISNLSPPPGTPPAATRRRLLDLAAVRFLVVPGPLWSRPDMAAFVRDGGLKQRPRIGWLWVFENPNALPRAFVAYRTHPAPDPKTLLARISEPTFDPLVASYVEGDLPLEPGDETTKRGRPASIILDEERVVELEATLEQPGLVVLADAYYPGWRATVDGVEANVVATNHLFRGVVAPAGTHRIRFEYSPASLRIGMLCSVLSWLAIGALAVRSHGATTAPASRPRRADRAPARGSD